MFALVTSDSPKASNAPGKFDSQQPEEMRQINATAYFAAAALCTQRLESFQDSTEKYNCLVGP